MNSFAYVQQVFILSENEQLERPNFNTIYTYESMGNAYKSTEDRLKGDPYIGVCNQVLETAECLLNESIVTLF